MAQAVSALGLGSFNLLGTSFGARTALYLAAQAPERVTTLVLEAPAAIRPAGATPPSGTPQEIARLIYAHPDRMPALPAHDPAIQAQIARLVGRLRGPDRDAALEKLLPGETTPPASIHAAMRYSVFAGGKRIRPILCLEAARVFEEDVTPALHPASGIECIHTYSLIHDDLPALDNDDLRRGKPTCHKQFGEATAILAGDALLTLAFELVGATPVDAERRVAMLTEVATAAGTVNGMVGGQMADIEAEGKRIGAKMLEYIHRSKTAALIRASVTAGALCAGAHRVRRGSTVSPGRGGGAQT